MSIKCNTLPLKNLTPSCPDGANVDTEIPEEVRFLLDELYELDDLSAQDWKEVYEFILRKLPELRSYPQVLAAIYRAIELRSDFITANRITGKFSRLIRLLFRKTEMAKLSGDKELEKKEYYVPTLYGIWLFEHLISPFDRAEVRAKVEERLAAVRQLSLMSFLRNARQGVRV